MKKQYRVKLSKVEVEKLKKLLSNGNAPAKHHKIARILLAVDDSRETGLSDYKAQKATGSSGSTIARVRKKYAEGGLEKVFAKKFTPRLSTRKFDGDKEAQLVTLCCSKPPKGRASWTIRLLAEEVVKLEILESVGRETIRQTLKKMRLNPGKS